MRITNSMMVSQFLTESNEALGRLSKYQSQVDSTKRINGIADDPQATLLALKARNRLSNLEMFKSNVSMASSYLKEAESATTELNEILQSAYGELVSAQSGAKSPDEQKIIAENLKNLQKEILSIANTTMGTSYLFGGYNYTGTISLGTKKAPFQVDDVTGHLSYNGVDLSQFAHYEDYNNDMAQMATDLKALTDTYYKYSATNTDAYNKSLAQTALEAANNLIARGKSALENVKAFSGSIDTTALSEFIYGSDDTSVTPPVHTNGLVDFADVLYNETSKDLTGASVLETDASIRKNADGTIDYDYYEDQGIAVYKDAADRADKTANDFKATGTSSAQTALTDVLEHLWGGPLPAPPAPEPTWTEPLVASATWTATDVGALTAGLETQLAGILNPAPQAALDNEMGKSTKLQIGAGADQTIDITYTGLDLLGTGSNNIYHILGRAIELLESENGADPDQLSSMITSMQNAQGSVLTLQTGIGASQNRLTLITNRYTSNELNYEEMKSNAEDADMTEAIMNWKMAQQVYNAALAGGAEIIKTSLIDFLR